MLRMMESLQYVLQESLLACWWVAHFCLFGRRQKFGCDLLSAVLLQLIGTLPAQYAWCYLAAGKFVFRCMPMYRPNIGGLHGIACCPEWNITAQNHMDCTGYLL